MIRSKTRKRLDLRSFADPNEAKESEKRKRQEVRRRFIDVQIRRAIFLLVIMACAAGIMHPLSYGLFCQAIITLFITVVFVGAAHESEQAPYTAGGKALMVMSPSIISLFALFSFEEMVEPKQMHKDASNEIKMVKGENHGRIRVVLPYMHNTQFAPTIFNDSMEFTWGSNKFWFYIKIMAGENDKSMVKKFNANNFNEVKQDLIKRVKAHISDVCTPFANETTAEAPSKEELEAMITKQLDFSELPVIWDGTIRMGGI